jgi:antitoxin MazE
MKTHVQKWGNSLALRIPKIFVTEMELEIDSPVEISLIEGKLILEPILNSQLELEQLLDQITSENIHNEVDTGAAVGREIW